FPMIIALIHRPFYVMVVDNLIIQNKTKHIATLSISAALINLILNIVLIPFFGTIAAVYSTAIAYLYLGFAGLIFKKIKLELTGIYNTHYIFILTSAVTAIFFINYLNF